MKTVGIIGYGSFGEFLCTALRTSVSLKVYDPQKHVPASLKSSIEEVAACDYVVLAVPLDAYESVVSSIAPKLSRQSVVVDISSVKSEPMRLLNMLLPSAKKVFTHPLFGPQSAADSLHGHVLVMCPEVSDPEAFAILKDFATKLGLKVIEKTTEEHDREMAYAQGLTFFVARALMKSNIHDIELRTPSFKKLLDLAELESHHSDDLFRTIQLGNTFTRKVRASFARQVAELLEELTEDGD